MEGIKSTISIGKETTWGQAVTPSLTIPVYPSDGLTLNQEIAGVETLKGTPAKNKAFTRGKTIYEGGFSMPLYPQAIGYFLLSIFGNVTSSQIETGAYNHLFTESVEKKSLTVEQNLAGVMNKRYAGFQVGNIKISGKSGEALNVEMEGIAKSQATENPITPVFETRRVFNFSDITALSIGGVNVMNKCESFEIEYDIGLEAFHGLGSFEAQKFYVKQSEVKGKIVLILDGTTKNYYDDVLGGNEKEIILDVVGELVGATVRDEVKITIPKVYLSKFETKLDFDYTAVNLEFEAREDETEGLIKAIVKNGVASY